jgi:hypothetical protein
VSLRTTDIAAYGDTWGGIRASGVDIKITPRDDASIEVKDNAWVTPETVFAD